MNNVVLGLLKALSFVYDVVTYPVYAFIQQPWKTKELAVKPRAEAIASEEGLTIRSTQPPCPLHLQLLEAKVDTLPKLLNFSVQRYGAWPCLGTREILAEEDETQPNGRVFKKYVMGDYKWRSFLDVDKESDSFGKGLRELGFQPHDKVVIFAETRAEWLVAAYGCFKQNISVVTLYATLGDEALAHGINETEVTCIISTHELLPKLKPVLQKTPKVKTIIFMEDQLKKTDVKGAGEDVEVLSFKNVIELGSKSTKEGVPPSSEDVAIVMYTSGSTGTPKGVLLSHKNIVRSITCFTDYFQVKEQEVYMAYLPLAHVLELQAEGLCLAYGLRIGYSTPLTMMDKSSKIKRGSKGDATVLCPSIMASVPLILDRICKGVKETVDKGGEFGQLVFYFAYQYKLKWYRRGFQTPLLDQLVFQNVKQLLGGKMRLMLSGGAPLSPDTHDFIRTCLCVKLVIGYGLTETSACACLQDVNDMSVGRVGGPVKCCDLRLVDWEEGKYRISDKPYPRGEVVIGGDNVTLGYYKLEEQTKQDFFKEDGRCWFRTGDIGELHEDGVLKLIDRKKDLVKLQFGEYVALGKVESELKTSALVENICVYGDSTKDFTVAIMVPNGQQLMQFAKKLGLNGVTLEHMCKDPEVQRAVLKELQDHGKKRKLEKFELPAAVTLCSDVWSPDSGLVTAAFKLKRRNIQEQYQIEINRMYGM